MNNMDWIEKLELLKETLGAEATLEEVCRAIGAIEADEILGYIIRVYDLNMDETEE